MLCSANHKRYKDFLGRYLDILARYLDLLRRYFFISRGPGPVNSIWFYFILKKKEEISYEVVEITY